MPYELLFLQALCYTIVAEILVGWTLQKFAPKYFGIAVKGWRFFIFIAVASCLTLPYIWFIWPYFVHDRLTFLILSELWVAIVEGFYYIFSFKMPWPKAMVFSFLVNAFSLGLGLLIF